MATPIGGSTDTQPPSAPGTLSGSVKGTSEIDLSWGAATDNVGVTGYQIWRCQGAGCTNFAQVAQPAGHRHDVPGHRTGRRHELQLRGPRRRRGRQRRPVLQRVHGGDAGKRRHAAAVGAGDAERVGQ